MSIPTGRRGFLARISAAAAAFAAAPVLATPLGATEAAAGGDDAEPWLRNLRGKHRQLFHSHDKMDATVLWQARAFIDLYQQSYGVRADQLSVVVAAHGQTGGMLFNDTLWSKYELGKMYRVAMRDPNAAPAGSAPAPAAPASTAPASTQAAANEAKPAEAKPAEVKPADAKPAWPPAGRIAATRNVYYAAQPGDPVNDQTSISELQKLGVTFLICDNALKQFSGYIARKSGSTPEQALEELRGNLVPGAIAVPTMLIAINRAQEKGCSYLYSG